MPYLIKENQGDVLSVKAGGLVDIEDEHGLKIAGVEITAVNAGAALLENVTGGTVTASKAAVVDANKRLDVLCVGDLKLGAAAGTSVTATATELSEYALTVCMADAGTAGSVFVVLPHAGEIRGLSVVNNAANATTKTVFGAKIGATSVTHAAWELALNAAAGTKSSVVPSAENAVAADSVLEITSDGGSSSVMPVTFTVKILR